MNYAEEFIRRPLRAADHERVIGGLVLPWGEKRVEVALFRHGERRASLQITNEGAEIVASAIDRLHACKHDEAIGTFVDGRFSVEVTTGKHQTGRAIYLQKRDASYVEAGAPVSLFGDEVAALATAFAWLWSAS